MLLENTTMARTTFIDLGGRKKGLPRGKPFKKGQRLPFQFKPGQSGNPGGRPKSRQTMKSITLITRSVLCRLALSGDSAHPLEEAKTLDMYDNIRRGLFQWQVTCFDYLFQPVPGTIPVPSLIVRSWSAGTALNFPAARSANGRQCPRLVSAPSPKCNRGSLHE